MKKLTFKTIQGCIRIMLILMLTVLVASFCARLVTTSGGKIKVEKLNIDARGATIDAEIYYPAGTSSKDSLPCVIFTHGGSIHAQSYRQFAQELSRRGFVTLMVNCYGNGTSEMPVYEELGQGKDGYNSMASPIGMLDVVNYARGLAFVDPTKIGVSGHSMGALRSNSATLNDCFFFSYNDLCINILYDTFGIAFKEEEIAQDAFAIAKAKLNSDQYAYFEYLANEVKVEYDTRIKALLDLGMTMCSPLAPKKVSVGGIEVTRTCKVNIGFANGAFETGMLTFESKADTMTAFQTAAPVVRFDWYALDDVAAASTDLGALGTKSAALADAANNRSLRVSSTSNDTHSKLYFSKGCVANAIEYFQVALDYNVSDLKSTSQTWPIRTFFNTVAMFAMLAILFPFVALLTKTEFFAPVIAPLASESDRPALPRWFTIVSAVVTAAVAMWACKVANANFAKFYNWGLLYNTKVYKVQSGGNGSRIYLFWMAVLSVVLLAAGVVISKKGSKKTTGLKALNINVGVKTFFKAVLMGIIFLVFAYSLLMTVEYWFEEDFRLWQTAFGEVRTENWWRLVPYYISFFIMYIPIALNVNYGKNYSTKEWKDTLITVAINSIGVWIACAYTFFAIRGANWDGSFTFNFMLIYCLNLFVPLTIYIIRKTFNYTHSIWLGVAICAVLATWLINGNSYAFWNPQTTLGYILG